MAYRAAVVGGSGYTGAELLRLLAGHPEIEVVLVTADSNAGRHGRRPLPVARRAYAGLTYAHVDADRPRRPRRRVPARSRTAQSQAIAADLVDTVGHVVDLGADFRLPVADVRAVVRRGARARPSCSTSSRSACPSSTATRSSPPRTSRVARLLPDQRVARAGAAARSRSRRADRHRGRRGVGRVGRGPGLKATSLFAEANENVTAYGLLTHRHTARDGAGARARRRRAGAGALHAAPRADDPRHPRHLLRAARRRRPVDRAAARAATASSTPTSRSCVVTDEPPAHQGDARRRTPRTSPCATTPRTDTVLAIGAVDNLVKGASGPGDAERQPRARPARDHRLCSARSGSHAVSVTAARRVRGRRARVRHQGRRARPTSRIVATDDGAPVTAAGVFTTNLVAAAPVQVSRAAPRRRPRGRGRAQLRQRQRRDRRAGPRATRCACASSPPQALGCATDRRARVLDRPHRHPDADGRRSRPGIPKLVRELARRRGGGDAAAEAMHDHRHRAQGDGAAADVARGAPRPSAAWPRARRCSSPAMATMLAVLTTDAAVDAGALRRALARPRSPSVQLPRRRRLPQHQRHRARARQRRAGNGRSTLDRPTRRSPTRSPTCARSLAEQMARRRRGRDQVRHASRVRRRAVRRRSAHRGPRPSRDSQLVQCSLNGEDPYWGRVLSELGASGAFFDPEQVDIAYNGVAVCRDGIACRARRRRAGASSWPRREIEIVCDLHAGTRRGDGALHRPLARVHRREHGARRERRLADAHDGRGGEGARSSPRRCRTSASSRARPS